MGDSSFALKCVGSILAYNGVLANLYDLHGHRATIYDCHGSLILVFFMNLAINERTQPRPARFEGRCGEKNMEGPGGHFQTSSDVTSSKVSTDFYPSLNCKTVAIIRHFVTLMA